MSASRESLACFKAYDIRGRIPDELNTELAYKVGEAYAAFLRPSKVVLGHDIRLSSREIADATREGLLDSGVDVIDIGQSGTEHVYFATSHLGVDGGIMVTASHNPKDYNGLKLVREDSRPISSDTGLMDIERLILEGDLTKSDRRGTASTADIQDDYIQHLMTYVDRDALKPLKVVVNAGNGGAGPTIDLLEKHLPFEFVNVHHEPDGTFPHGIPNPLLPDNRKATSDAVKQSNADVGIAWDGDFDRCFFFDETGGFIEGYYIVGLLAANVLAEEQGGRVVHDPRLTWNTLEMVTQAGGVPVQSKSGHAFIKEVMRREDAVYGGEMSAHHFFRRFSYCDSGMIPWLMVLEIMCRQGRSLRSLVEERMTLFPASGEINRKLDDPEAAIARIRATYEGDALKVDETDGVGFDFTDWRFNLRKSNTEPLIRLNVESRGDSELMERRTKEVLAVLDGE
jgi:phosphomannomutase